MESYPNQNYIAGQWLEGENTLEVVDKYSGKLISNVALASEVQVELAVSSALEAFNRIKNKSKQDRIDILDSLAQKLKENKKQLSELICLEAGKPIAYAKMEVDRSIYTLEAAVRELYSFEGEVIPMGFLNAKSKSAFTKRKPMGVVLGISPFNFPLNLAMHKIAPAIATSNSIILKPAPQSPLTILFLAKLLDELNLEKGQVNVLMCDNQLAEKLVRDPRISILSFTGSPEIGWMLKNIAGKKKVLLELGGNAASIVDKTADVEVAAKQLSVASFLYSGQICISTQRIFVHRDNFDFFVEKFRNFALDLKSGDPKEIGTINGPLISRQHLLRIKIWVDQAISQGAKLLFGGDYFDEKSNVFQITALSNTTVDMKINAEEAFAPVVVIEKFENIEEAIDLVNSSKYGLQASIYSNDFSNINYCFEHLEVGALIVNDIPGFRVDSMPYGGVKESGFGREGLKYSMFEYTEPRMIVY